jgi:hypothetical protein
MPSPEHGVLGTGDYAHMLKIFDFECRRSQCPQARQPNTRISARTYSDATFATVWTKRSEVAVAGLTQVIIARRGSDIGLFFYTAQAFSDFTLRLQFRLDSREDNSGVFFAFAIPVASSGWPD